MGNALGDLTTFEAVEAIVGWNFTALSTFGCEWWYSQIVADKNSFSSESVVLMRFAGLFLATAKSAQYLIFTSKDKELKRKGYMMSGACWLGCAAIMATSWDKVDPIMAKMHMPIYLGMAGAFFYQAQNMDETKSD